MLDTFTEILCASCKWSNCRAGQEADVVINTQWGHSPKMHTQHMHHITERLQRFGFSLRTLHKKRERKNKVHHFDGFYGKMLFPIPASFFPHLLNVCSAAGTSVFCHSPFHYCENIKCWLRDILKNDFQFKKWGELNNARPVWSERRQTRYVRRKWRSDVWKCFCQQKGAEW